MGYQLYNYLYQPDKGWSESPALELWDTHYAKEAHRKNVGQLKQALARRVKAVKLTLAPWEETPNPTGDGTMSSVKPRQTDYILAEYIWDSDKHTLDVVFTKKKCGADDGFIVAKFYANGYRLKRFSPFAMMKGVREKIKAFEDQGYNVIRVFSRTRQVTTTIGKSDFEDLITHD